MAELGLIPLPDHEPKLRDLRQHFMRLVVDASKTTENINPNRFPGTMALTLSRRHMGMICVSDYVALEKSDGTRYMLLALSSHVFLIDRLMKFYVVDPNPNILSMETFEPQNDTILDGELVRNLITQEYEFLIYDAVIIDGKFEVGTMDFRARMSQAELFVISMRVTTPVATGRLRMRLKDYYEKKDVRKLFARIKKDHRGEYVYINNDRRDGVICNLNDGVIFTPVGKPYVVKNCDALLKWKPPHLNSVDFQLILERTKHHRTGEPSVNTSIAYKGERSTVTLRPVHFPSKQKIEWAKSFDKYHKSIVELSYDRIAGEWRYIRQREDKETPNFSSTVIDTLESIAESMDREEMVSYLERESRPPMPAAEPFLKANAKNAEVCKVRDDLYDADNKNYLLSTPVSLIPQPYMERPPHLRGRGRGGGRQQHSNRNLDAVGGGPPAQNDAERMQPDYSDDV